MRSPLRLLGLGLLGSSLFLSQVHAAPRVAAPVVRPAPRVAARIAATPRVARPALATRKVALDKASVKPTLGAAPAKLSLGAAPAKLSLGAAPAKLSLGASTGNALSGPKASTFSKLIGLFGAPRATITTGDPTAKQGTPGTVPGAKTFVDGVSYKDVDQGYLGDCYFVAALDAVAYTHPALITKNLKENKDGTISLRMYHQTSAGKYTSDTVNMSKTVPIGTDGKPSFARGADPTQMWPSYFQKGFVMQAATNGGKTNAFQSIEGGFPGDAFSTLTGKPSQRYDVNAGVGDQLFTVMQHANATKHPVAAWTPGTLPEGGLVHGDHTYTVLGVTQHDGQKFVQLRNPWGFSPGTDGIFELDLPTFAKTFVGMDVGG